MTHTLPQSHFSRHHERFFFLYGKTDDEFCVLPEGILRLEEVLHRHLAEIGYRRILFFNGSQKLYFYDHESKRLCRRDAQDTPSPQTPAPRQRKMCAGPLGMRKVRRTTPPASNIQHQTSSIQHQTSSIKHPASNIQHPASLTFGRMNDLEMVSMMNYCMKDEAVKTAVLFTDGLDFINHTEHGAIRQMAGNLNRWSGLFSDNENICIFLIPDLDTQGIRRLLDRTPHWQFLLTKMFAQEDQPSEEMLYVGPPRQDEVESLFHYYRLKNGLRADWRSFPQAVISVTRNLCAKGERLKSLSVQLKPLTNLDTETLTALSRQTREKSAMDRLRSMRGLEAVARKIEQFIALQKESESEAQIENSSPNRESENRNPFPLRLMPPAPISESPSERPLNLNLVLTGNPGTGKTTVGNLLGEILRDAGLLELGHTVKASKDELVAGYVGQTALRTAGKISDAMGGVLFADEAYRLTEDDDFGKEALETVMEAMSSHTGEFSVVIAGYPGRIEEFLEANPGLRRRFGHQNMIQIQDYEPLVLQHIFEQEVRGSNRHTDPALRQILPDFFINWHAARDPETFGNAGDVKNIFQEMDVRRAERVQGMELDRESRNTFTPEDVPERLREYLRPRKAATVEEALSLLDGLTGLAEIKAWVRRRTLMIQMQQEQQRRGMTTESPVPGHYLFLGRPGTGKTTVARLLGSIFQLLGILGRSEVLEVGPGDLIDKFVGGTEEKARKVFKKGLNSVLFIDEAHNLAEGGDHGPGRIVVKELVPFMLNNKENLSVVAAGYPEEMEKFLELDPGLKSRFSKIITFEDFNEAELSEIFNRLLNKNGEIAGPRLAEDIRRLFKVWVADKDRDFGNARDVGRLEEQMRECRAERLAGCDIATCSNEDMQTFLPEDIPEKERQRMGKRVERLEDIMDSLDNLIGLSRVKGMIRTMINRLRLEKMRGDGGVLAPGHYLFVGNPGTGKTTVARKMGEIFRALGLLVKGHLTETGRSDLVAGYQGQTALKTRKVLESSLDGVLFIDEAYQLVEDDRDSFGKEAMETLVAFMENHRDRLCIIAAGYPEPMRRFVHRNPGLPSRFTAEISFENYNAQEMLEIFKSMAACDRMTLGQGVEDALFFTFERMVRKAGPTFGNGREVRNLLERMCARHANRLAETAVSQDQSDRAALFRLEREDLPE